MSIGAHIDGSTLRPVALADPTDWLDATWCRMVEFQHLEPRKFKQIQVRKRAWSSSENNTYRIRGYDAVAYEPWGQSRPPDGRFCERPSWTAETVPGRRHQG